MSGWTRWCSSCCIERTTRYRVRTLLTNANAFRVVQRQCTGDLPDQRLIVLLLLAGETVQVQDLHLLQYSRLAAFSSTQQQALDDLPLLVVCGLELGVDALGEGFGCGVRAVGCDAGAAVAHGGGMYLWNVFGCVSLALSSSDQPALFEAGQVLDVYAKGPSMTR